jgi:hypothetical protein
LYAYPQAVIEVDGADVFNDDDRVAVDARASANRQPVGNQRRTGVTAALLAACTHNVQARVCKMQAQCDSPDTPVFVIVDALIII